MTINVMTPAAATQLICPQTMQLTNAKRKCCAQACMAWRWLPLQTDEPGFLEAVKTVQSGKHKGGKPMAHAQAAAYVGAHRDEFGLKSEVYQGFCGLAGGWRVT